MPAQPPHPAEPPQAPGQYRTAAPSPFPVAAPADHGEVDGEGIYCPLCNYNLTGALSGRCPECGALFNRHALIAAQRTNRVTLIPWDSPRNMPLRQRLWSTLRICLLKPDRFAFAFSVQPQKTRAGKLMALVVLTTIFAGAVMIAISSSFGPTMAGWRTTDVGVTMLAVALFLAVLIGGTTLCTGLFLGAMCPHYDGKRHLRPWLAISAYASSHYLMLLCVLPFAFLDPWVDGLRILTLGLSVCGGCGVLCSLTLVSVVEHRTAARLRGPIVSVVLVAIPLLGLAIAVLTASALPSAIAALRIF